MAIIMHNNYLRVNGTPQKHAVFAIVSRKLIRNYFVEEFFSIGLAVFFKFKKKLVFLKRQVSGI
jgi:hypothetical protein